VFIAAEPYVDSRIALAVRQFVSSHLVGVGSQRVFEKAAHSAMRRRDSALAEVFMLVAAFAVAGLSRTEPGRAWMFAGEGGPPTPAGWWYLALSKPLLRFLLLRWLWRGILWAGFLFRVSRLPLAMLPTHPDMMGGLGFLPRCQASFSPVVFALASMVAAHLWQQEPHGVVGTPMPYFVPLVVLGALAALAVCAPLGFFTPQLVKAKRRGDIRFSALAAWHSWRFEHKWFRAGASADAAAEGKLLGAPEISSLADLGTAFTTARKMRLFLYDTRPMVGVVAAALAPLAFLLLMDQKLLDVLKQIYEALP
jgi:hypothetical protein